VNSPLEVDAVIEGSWGKWATEVKTAPISSMGVRGLAEFTRCHKAYRSVVLCDDDQLNAIARTGLDAVVTSESDGIW
jgi:hypothetical protein